MKNKIPRSAVAVWGGYTHPQSAARVLALAAAIMSLDSCGTTTRPAPRGVAMLDVTPDRERRDRITGLELVSVNGTSVGGTEVSLKPGRNVVRTRFQWPQGGAQEVELSFHAKEGSSYFVQYDPTPPRANRLVEPTKWDDRAAAFAHLGVGAGEAGFLVAPPALALLGAGFIGRAANQIAEAHRPAFKMDIMVVSHHSGEGVVRRVRAFPDGRVDSATWAAYAK